MVVDEAQYKDVEEPDKNNVQAWTAALDKVKINSIISDSQRLNLELDRQFGTGVWKENLIQQHNLSDRVQKHTKVVEKEIEEINRKRKFSQIN